MVGKLQVTPWLPIEYGTWIPLALWLPPTSNHWIVKGCNTTIHPSKVSLWDSLRMSRRWDSSRGSGHPRAVPLTCLERSVTCHAACFSAFFGALISKTTTRSLDRNMFFFQATARCCLPKLSWYIYADYPKSEMLWVLKQIYEIIFVVISQILIQTLRWTSIMSSLF